MPETEPISLERKVDRIHYRLDTFQKQLDKLEYRADHPSNEFIWRVEFEPYRKAIERQMEQVYKDFATEIGKVNASNYWPNRIVIAMASMVLVAFFGYVISNAFKP